MLAALLLYLSVAVVTIFACHRWVTPVSRGVAIVLMLLPFLFTGQALVTNRVYGGYDILFLSQPFSDYAQDYGVTSAHNGWLVDHVLQMVPWQRQVRESFAHGEWPLWNPAMDSGEVLAAGMQVAPLNPLNLIAMLLPLDLATTFSAAMVFFLAALFTYLFARELDCSEGAALIAAAGFSLCSAMAFFGTWPHGRSWTLLPFVLLAVRRIVRAGDAAAFALLTIALTLLIVFGHPETMLHIATIGVVYGIFELVPVRSSWRRSSLLALAAGAIAILLTAISLWPFIAALPFSFEYYIRRNPPPLTAAHEVWRAIRATFIPYYGGATWHSPTSEFDFGLARVGSVTLALAVVASLRLWRRREVRFLILLCVITLLISWKAPFADAVLRALPLFKMAFNDRLGFAAALAMSLLAAFAFDAIAPQRSRPIVIAVAAALAVATAWFWRMQLSIGVDRRLLIAGAAAELIGIAMLLAALSGPSRRVAAMLIIAAIAGQRFVEDSNIHPTLSRRAFYPTVPLVAAVPRDPLFRFTAIGNMVVPNVATMYGLEDIRGYSAMTYVPYVETMPLWCPDRKRTYHDVNDLSLPFLTFLGVRYAITPRAMEPPDGWRVVADDRSSRLMRNTRALPRVFIPRRIRFTDSDQTTNEEMAAATDFSEQAWVLSRDSPPRMIENGQGTLLVRRVGSRYHVDVSTRTGCRVVLSEVSWPGWRAYLDGNRVSVDQTNRAFLSVYVPQGQHRLRLVYLPDAFVWGRAVSIATLFAIAVTCAVVASRRSRRKMRPAHPAQA